MRLGRCSALTLSVRTLSDVASATVFSELCGPAGISQFSAVSLLTSVRYPLRTFTTTGSGVSEAQVAGPEFDKSFDWSGSSDLSSKRLMPEDDDLFISPTEIDDEYAAGLAEQNYLAGLHKINVKGLKFNAPDIQNGRWLNYAVGMMGAFSQEEHDALWPNEVWHGKRSAYNLRDWYDLAQFLAEPSKELLEAHRDNLRRWAEDKKYHKKWVYHAMCNRWGPDPILSHGIRFD
ncbi:hypothetical protein WJX73_006143 [Symbiochloris irregularis]|uniref:Uncharacterized protein n=1 Tax=Symbiochloris irregularis TaxID=706552 RepID=A0AAW1NRS9_9CHLO